MFGNIIEVLGSLSCFDVGRYSEMCDGFAQRKIMRAYMVELIHYGFVLDDGLPEDFLQSWGVQMVGKGLLELRFFVLGFP